MNVQKFVFALKLVVRDLRHRWDKSQDEFAKLLGLSQATVVKLEKARYDKLPQHETLIPIAEALNIPYWKLIKQLEEYEPSRESKIAEIEDEPMSKYKIIAAIIKLNDFDDCYEVVQSAVQRGQELRYQQAQSDSYNSR